jgi:exonuclease SbcC
MRPVLLDLDGFASFRTPTVIDFTDVDYFALVGATGAGKSTVIDAITFALYSTVPRWQDKRVVTPALAPTVSRGVVRLVFDADGQRYVVARELRRGTGRSGRVEVKASRLERLTDPDDPNGATQLLAADSEVTGAVAKLLGLSYEHFTTCVVLPQGKFDQFLHAKPSERQEILSSLLGHQLYERLQREAGLRGRSYRDRAKMLGESLSDYADATEQAVTAAGQAAEGLAELERWLVESALPEFDAAGRTADELAQRVEELDSRHEALAAIRVPAGVDALETARQHTAAEVVLAQSEQTAAEEDCRRAREAVRALRPRHQLNALAQDWAELAEARARLPREAAAVQNAVAEHADADGRCNGAEQRVEQLRVASDQAAATARFDATEVTEQQRLIELLTSIAVPDDLADFAIRQQQLDARRRDVDAELGESEEQSRQAREQLEAAPTEGILDGMLRNATRMCQLLAADLAEASGRAAAEAQLADADNRLAAARQGLVRAEAELAAARLADEAGLLRAQLATGQPCPVCEQLVITVPALDEGCRVAEATVAVTKHQAELQNAAQDQQQLSSAVQEAEIRRRGMLEQAEELRTQLRSAVVQLAGMPGAAGLSEHRAAFADPLPPAAGLAAVKDAADRLAEKVGTLIDGRRTLLDRARDADDRWAAARRADAALAEQEAQLAGERGDQVRALHRVRDTVAGFGAPSLDVADPAEAWRQLADWAQAQRADRLGALAELSGRAKATAAEADRLANELDSATSELDRARKEASHHAGEVKLARARHDQTKLRIEALDGELAGQPDQAEVLQLLEQLAEREQQEQDSDERLAAAQARHAEARRAAAAISEQVEAAWTALRTIRDPLAGYGAPQPTGEDLLAAWDLFSRWADEQRTVIDRQLAEMGAKADAASGARVRIEQAIVQRFAEHELTAPAAGADFHRRTSEAAVRAATQARAAADRAAERLDTRNRIEADRVAAETQATVATELAGLLRSDAFQAWLLISALDDLVAEASQILKEISGGQFELQAADKDLVVIDHNDADLTRPVRTLSGGETFQASLALALALSHQVASLASSGAAKLESIFLDEGFGTLDEASLDVVGSTLENLAITGQRMVGVITHVPALAERVPVRFRVTRDARSSHIDREAG